MLAEWMERHVNTFLFQKAKLSRFQMGQAPSCASGRRDISIYEAIRPGLGLAPD